MLYLYSLSLNCISVVCIMLFVLCCLKYIVRTILLVLCCLYFAVNIMLLVFRCLYYVGL